MNLINKLTKASNFTPPLRRYQEAIKRGEWLDIAGSTMTTRERQIACSWYYQYRAHAALEASDFDRADEMAEGILLDCIRYQTWASIAKVYQAKGINLTQRLGKAIPDYVIRTKTRRAIDKALLSSGRQKKNNYERTNRRALAGRPFAVSHHSLPARQASQ